MLDNRTVTPVQNSIIVRYDDQEITKGDSTKAEKRHNFPDSTYFYAKIITVHHKTDDPDSTEIQLIERWFSYKSYLPTKDKSEWFGSRMARRLCSDSRKGKTCTDL